MSGFNTNPLPSIEFDYAMAGNIIDKAVKELNESLPGGEKERTEKAMKNLKHGVARLEIWCKAKGLDV